jgi:Trk K+ transport system NAD-binding subunit
LRCRGRWLRTTTSSSRSCAGSRCSVRGTDLELLESGDIGHGDLLVPVIDNDERNLLASPRNRIVGAILRGAEAIVPRGNDRVQPGDRLIVVTTHEEANRVRDYFTKVPA